MKDNVDVKVMSRCIAANAPLTHDLIEVLDAEIDPPGGLDDAAPDSSCPPRLHGQRTGEIMLRPRQQAPLARCPYAR